MDTRTTVALDADLVAGVQEATGIKQKSALINEALKQLVQRDADRRLVLLGGSEPDFVAAPRHRWEPDSSEMEDT